MRNWSRTIVRVCLRRRRVVRITHAYTRAYTHVVVESSLFREVSDQSRLCLVRCKKKCWVFPAPSLSLYHSLLLPWNLSRSRFSERPCEHVDGTRFRGNVARKIDRRISPAIEHRYGSSVLRNHRDGVPGLRGSGPPRRRPGSAEPPANRRALRAQQFLLRMRPEGHLAAHAQDRRRVDVGGKRLFPVHVEMYVTIALLHQAWTRCSA